MLRDVLEQSIGLKIFYLEIPAIYSGIYGYDEQIGGCLAVNLHHHEEQQRWFMAHGYLHFPIHRRKPGVIFESPHQRISEDK